MRHTCPPAALALGLVLTLAACGSPSDAVEADGDWALVSGHSADDQIEIVDGHVPTLTIEGYEITGTGGCNQIGFAEGEEELTDWPEEFIATQMACDPPEVMDQEARFLQALSDFTEVATSGDELVLSGPDSELRFEPAP